MKTDAQLQQDVIAELKWEPDITATRIGVEVNKGVVTLTGHVDSYAEKWNAERAALQVIGVTAPTMEIEVRLPGASQRGDADIARSIENVLTWTTSVPPGQVKVVVEKGWVTLSGQLEWSYQRDSAAMVVRHLLGVTGVSNDIAITPKLNLSAVKSDIEAALTRHAHADAAKISVAINGAEVTLSGKVDSWNERELAQRSAWSTPGVRRVVDNITIAC